MDDILKSERIRTLLRQADDAKRLLGALEPQAGDSSEVREALAGIYRDLGQELHQDWNTLLSSDGRTPSLAPSPPPAPPRMNFGPPDDVTDVPDVTGPAAHEELEGWYTDEVEVPEIHALFSPGDLEPAEAREAEGIHCVEPGDTKARITPVDPASPPQWLETLRLFLGPIDEGTGPLSPMDFCLRIQWASSQLDRAVNLPAPVQMSIAALLASHARSLQQRLPEELGPKMALERIRQWAMSTQLPGIAALSARSGGAGQDWAAAAEQWRSHIRTCTFL